jgi:hypothetical protein
MGEWRKSTYSNANGGDCVEVAADARLILVRDTTDRNGPVLAVSAVAWQEFTASL